jgi:hypothetical protein
MTPRKILAWTIAAPFLIACSPIILIWAVLAGAIWTAQWAFDVITEKS